MRPNSRLNLNSTAVFVFAFTIGRAILGTMGLWTIAVANLLAAAGIALACGLLMCVWMVKTQSQAAFTQTTTGFDAVLGARGSKLQLVLNAIFHLEASAGNLPAADYEAVRKMPMIKTAIPIAMGVEIVSASTDEYSVPQMNGSARTWSRPGSTPRAFSS